MSWFDAQPAKPIAMKLGTRIPWDATNTAFILYIYLKKVFVCLHQHHDLVLDLLNPLPSSLVLGFLGTQGLTWLYVWYGQCLSHWTLKQSKARSYLGECLFAEHTLDSSTNYESFLNWTFSSPNILRTVWRTMICFLIELLVCRT